MAEPVFVSYWTDRYAEHEADWAASARQFGLSTYSRWLESAGSWQKNCLIKPRFLLHCLGEFPGRPIVWVDIDARFMQFPQRLYDYAALEIRPDVAYHVFRLTGGRAEPLSGTIWLSDHDGYASLFLKEWDVQCRAKATITDQVLMDRVAKPKGTKTPWHVAELPAEYCFIFDIFREPFFQNSNPSVGEPVIEHLQASRAVRKAEAE